MSAKSIIKVIITGDAGGVKDAVLDATGSLSHLDKTHKTIGQKIKGHAKALATDTAAIALAAGSYAFKVGTDLQESQDVLGGALDNTHQKMSDLTKNGLGPLLTQNEKWGNTNADVNSSLATLLRTGDSAKKAIADQAEAANLAAFKHISLASATDMVVKANAGSTKIYKSMGITLKDVNGKVKTQAELHKELAARLKGVASTAAGSFQGKLKAMHAQLTDVAAKIGIKLIPMVLWLANALVKYVIPAVEKVAGWITKTMIPALSGFGLKIADLYNTYVKPTVDGIVSYFKGLFQAIKGVVSLIVDLFHGDFGKAWDDVKAIVSGVIDSMVGLFVAFPGRVVSAVGNLAKTLWDHIKGPFDNVKTDVSNWVGNVVSFFTGLPGKVVSGVGNLAKTLWDHIKDTFDKVKGDISGWIGNVVSFFIGLPGKIVATAADLYNKVKSVGGKIASGMLDGIKSAAGAVADFAKAIYNAIKGFINDHIIIPIDVTLHGISAFGVHPFTSERTIPTLHTGGIFNSGKGEGLALLQDGERVLTRAQTAAGVGGGGNTVIHINMPAGIDPSAVVAAQRRYARRNGLA